MLIDPYVELANAIIKSAAKDYMAALKILNRHPTSVNAKATVDECERFFRSSWYQKLTNVDGEFLIRKMQEEVLKNDHKRLFKTGLSSKREN